MATAEGRARARAALAGNPSDGYGGATLAVTIPRLEARAVAAHAASPRPPIPLVEAAMRRFRSHTGHDTAGIDIDWSTTIPRCVGLGGSSAIVISTLRALCGLCGAAFGPDELAHIALAVETEELGIAAGLQDRAAQAFGGLTFMELGTDPERFERLDPELLPLLAIAYRGESSAASGTVHTELRSRFAAGDPAVHAAMTALADAARRARDALQIGDRSAFAESVDATYDLRIKLMGDLLDPRHRAMIDTARAAGAAANYTGSGGAIVAVCRDEPHRQVVLAALAQVGCQTLALNHI
jgi:glucuronokinase